MKEWYVDKIENAEIVEYTYREGQKNVDWIF